jgi:hypothetical protein
MKPHFSEPETHADYNERLERFDRLWRHRQITDATYLRSLFIDGVDASEARSRLAMLKMERP